MLNRVQISHPLTFQAKAETMPTESVEGFNQIPIARKINDDKQRTVGALSILIAGGIAGPFVGKGLDILSGGVNSPLVKWSGKIASKTPQFDIFMDKLAIGDKLRKLYDPIKLKLFKTENLKNFSKGFHSGGGLKGAAEAARDVAIQTGNVSKQAVAQRSLETLKHLEGMGRLGKLFGKTGVFFKKNLTGTVGVMNGLFAAMTVNSVYKAKKGEKISTFMEDFLGTWIGSLGGYRLFENILKGLGEFAVDSAGKATARGTFPTASKIAGNGIIPFIAKVVNKIPFKGFVFPMIGAMLISSIMQKFSHAIFGKPTKEEPVVIDSYDSFNNWLTQTGWKVENNQFVPPPAETTQKIQAK